jgi:hypothetical protein
VTYRERYTPGPASGAQVRKDRGQNDEDKWTLILVRELRHSPEKIWQALTDLAHLREWASLRRRSEPGYGWNHGEAYHRGFDMRWELEALGGGTHLTLWANIGHRFIAVGAVG